MRALLSGIVAAWLVLAPSAAAAQAMMCTPPAKLRQPRPDLPSAREPRRVLPIGGYTLALTWNPGYCRAHRGAEDARFRCAAGNRFGFTLHGLWPDGVGRQWPQYCAAARIVPPSLVRPMMCVTPSEQLIQHEWAKHGTCANLSIKDYFGLGTRLYSGLRFPDMASLSRRPLTVGEFKAQLAAANPGVPAEAVRVTLARGNWLDELWFCLDTRLRYARCRPGTGGARDDAPLRIWRGGR